MSLACWIMCHCCGQVSLHRNHWHYRAAVNLDLRGKTVLSIHVPSADPNGCRGSSQGGLISISKNCYEDSGCAGFCGASDIPNNTPHSPVIPVEGHNNINACPGFSAGMMCGYYLCFMCVRIKRHGHLRNYHFFLIENKSFPAVEFRIASATDPGLVCHVPIKHGAVCAWRALRLHGAIAHLHCNHIQPAITSITPG